MPEGEEIESLSSDEELKKIDIFNQVCSEKSSEDDESGTDSDIAAFRSQPSKFLAEIIEKIKSNDKNIAKLDLSKQKLADADIINIAEALKENTTLKELDLSENNITHEGVKALLKNNRSIVSLNLSYNDIQKLYQFSSDLENDTTLQKLYLFGNTEDPTDYDNQLPAVSRFLCLYPNKNTVIEYIDIASDKCDFHYVSYPLLIDQFSEMFERNAKYNKIRGVIVFAKEMLCQPTNIYASSQQELFSRMCNAKENCEELVAQKKYGADALLHEVYCTLALIYERNSQHKELLELYLNYFLKHSEFSRDDVSLALASAILNHDDWLKNKEKWTAVVLLLKDSKDEKLRGLAARCYTALKENNKTLPPPNAENLVFPKDDREIAQALKLDTSSEIELTFLLTNLMKKVCRNENKAEHNDGYRTSAFYSSSSHSSGMFYASKRKREEDNANDTKELEKKKMKSEATPVSEEGMEVDTHNAEISEGSDANANRPSNS